MKLNKAVVGLMIGSSLLGGIVTVNSFNAPIEAKSSKAIDVIKSRDDIYGKFDLKVSKVAKYTVNDSNYTPDKNEKNGILVDVEVTNKGKKALSLDDIDNDLQFEFKSGSNRYTLTHAYIPDEDLQSNQEWNAIPHDDTQQLEPKQSTHYLLKLGTDKLDQAKTIIVKPKGDDAKGSIKIKDVQKLPLVTLTNNESDN